MKDEGFVVSALKYRPAEWDEVVGQDSIVSTLKNAINSEELAKAYLFCGPRGVGKTTCARIYAKAINSKHIEDGQDLSFNVFELDAASNNSVDDIRQLIDQVRIQPQLGKYKVYIIDEVHMLSTQAFNAFLKTLEEPPPHAIFILATTEKHKVLPTILSRCQIYDFQRIQVRDMVSHLAKIAEDQNVNYQEEALHLIATKADGALRDALSLFDQMVSFTGKDLEYNSVATNLNVLDYDYYNRIVDAMVSGAVGEALLVYDEILEKGFDSLLFLVGLAEHLRNVLVAMDQGTIKLLDCPDNVKQEYLRQSGVMDIDTIISHLKVIQKTEVDYRSSKNKRLLTEITLMKLCSIGESISDESVQKKRALALNQ
ncbi:MAG: DNA polymerase III subunit gamma/tau [Flavobacteriales bacterium]|nr:DNA polymerase III subunit gamma/tau [Flavobacteriales bacterium]